MYYTEELNEKLDEIIKLLKRNLEQSSAVREELEEMKGYGLDNSISDVCDKLDGIQCGLAEGSSL